MEKIKPIELPAGRYLSLREYAAAKGVATTTILNRIKGHSYYTKDGLKRSPPKDDANKPEAYRIGQQWIIRLQPNE